MEDKNKKKSDKLLKQSFALLDKIKHRKEKQVFVPANQENYVEDLYLKILGKCSPHSNKAETANSILVHVKQREKQLSKKNADFEDLRREFEDLRNQNFRLKESKDEVGRIKSLNAQIQILEQKAKVISTQLKDVKRENDKYIEMAENLKQENTALKESNTQLQELVDKLSKQLQSYLTAEQTAADTSQLGQLKLRNAQLQKEVKSLAHQRQLMKESIETNRRIYEQKIQKVRSNESSTKKEAQGTQKIVQQLKWQLQKERARAQMLEKEAIGNKSVEQNMKKTKLEAQNLAMQVQRLRGKLQQMQKIHKQQQINKNTEQTKLKSKINQLNTIGEEQRQFNIEMKKKFEIQKQNLQSQNNTKELVAKITSFQAELKKQLEKSDGLQRQLRTLKERCFEVETLNQALRSELNNSLLNVQQSKVTLVEQRKRQKQWNQYQKEKQAQITTNNQQIKALKARISQKQMQKSKRNTQHQETSQKLNKIYKDLQSALNQNQQITKERNKQKIEFQSKIQEITERMKFFKRSYQQINNQKFELIQSIQALVEQNRTQAQQITKMQASEKGTKQSQVQQIKKNEQQIEARNAQLNGLKEELSNLKSQLAQVKDNSAETGEKLRISALDLQKAAKQKQQVMKQNSELEASLQQVSQRMKFFKTTNQELNNQKVDLITSIQALVAQNKTLAQELHQNRAKNSQLLAAHEQKYLLLKKQHEVSQLQCKSAEEQNQKFKEEIHQLKLQIQLIDLKTKNESLEEQILLQLPDKVPTLSSTASTKHIETIKELNGQLTQAYKTINLLSNKLQQYENNEKKEKQVTSKRSPESKDRGRSIKKIAGIFGFK